MRLFLALIAVVFAAPVWATVPDVISGPARVIDGDTFEIAGLRVRVQGIDTPERGEQCRTMSGIDWACGAHATQVARSLIAGRQVVCHDLGERSHDRVIARCLVDGSDFAELMLERGAARACPAYAERHAHSRRYMALERQAADRGHGLFASGAPPRAGFCHTDATRRAEIVPIPMAYDGQCLIKGNISRDGARIYHRPGQRHYSQTVIDTTAGERWFCTEAEARAAGWRPAQR